MNPYMVQKMERKKKSEMKGQGSYYGKGGTTEIKSSER